MATLMLCLSAGVALGVALNLFALLAFSATFAPLCLLASIGAGEAHPISTTLSSLLALQIGYATGLFEPCASARPEFLVARK